MKNNLLNFGSNIPEELTTEPGLSYLAGAVEAYRSV